MTEMEYVEGNMEETCDIKAFERNKYFYGKLMTVSDFETEQRYFNSKRSMLNRLIHGVGLVCGLEVSEPEIADEKLKLRLSTGVALDCCGHEIVNADVGVYDVDGSPAEGTNYIYLKYRECLKEPVPALSNPSACDEACCYSRIKESFKLELSQQAPPADVPLNWKNIWQERHQDIEDLASKLGIADPLGSLVAKLAISADEYLKTVGCPSCDDPKALLAVITVTGSSVEVDEDETLALRSVVYSNPMLYELLKSHLTDLDNPHQVTAEQTGALVSVDGVDNPGGNVDLVARNAITIAPDNNNNRITIGENHSARQDNPHNVTAEQVGALVSVDGITNPGGNIDLVEGDNIHIEPDATSSKIKISAKPGIASIDGIANPGGNIDLIEGEGIKIDPNPDARAIKISATGGTGGANTGIVQFTIPKATATAVVVAVLPAQPGHTIVRGIPHGLRTELSPAIILGLVTKMGIIMEEDFITQRALYELMANLYDVPIPPPVSFRALGVTNQKFDILAINTDLEKDLTITVRWWAVPAIQTIAGIDIGKIFDAVRERVGIEAIAAVASEKNVAESEVSVVVGEMMRAVSAESAGATIAIISSSSGLKAETTQPIIDALVAEGAIQVTGTGARRKYTIKG